MAGVKSKIKLNNNTIAYNKHKTNGGGIATIYEGTFTGANNIIFFNTKTQCSGNGINLTYTACSDNLSGNGNITSDPQFVNASSNDYNLKEGSPCIDKGDPSSDKDPDGTPADMGALFYNQGTDIGEKKVTETSDFKVMINSWGSSIVISYQFSSALNVDAEIINIAGEKVRAVTSERMSKGSCKMIWDCKNDTGYKVSPGIYFCRFMVGNYVDVVKMPLIK